MGVREREVLQAKCLKNSASAPFPKRFLEMNAHFDSTISVKIRHKTILSTVNLNSLCRNAAILVAMLEVFF